MATDMYNGRRDLHRPAFRLIIHINCNVLSELLTCLCSSPTRKALVPKYMCASICVKIKDISEA